MLHLQRNQILLIFWLLTLGFVSGALGKGLGIAYLFIVPEYLGSVNPGAYAIIGFAFGGFMIAFNVSSYVMNSHRFPFLATLRRPFLIYSFNNAVIPTTVMIVFLFNMYHHLRFNELMERGEIFANMAAYIGGVTLFVLLSSIYFYSVNKDFLKLFGVSAKDDPGESLEKAKLLKIRFLRKMLIAQVLRRSKYRDEWLVVSYLKHPLRIKRADNSDDVDRAKLLLVLQQNHINAAIFSIFVIITLFVLGWFRERKFFEVPAAASLILFLTMCTMLVAAVHFFLRKWSTMFFIGVLFCLNWLSTRSDFRAINYAYGIDYSHKTIYDPEKIESEIRTTDVMQNDIAYHEAILDKWKEKAYVNPYISKKPKIVFINCSGGGLKSALWTFYCMQFSNQALEGNLLRNTFLITGSSGGMIGASYLRELYLMQQQGIIDDLYDPQWSENVSKDILNPIAASIALNDLFLRWQRFTEGNYSYPKDRGYEFERKLNENTEHVLDKRLGDYTEVEKEALVPMMIFSPSITNDAKRLIIASHPMSFMSYNAIRGDEPMYMENIEFTRLFKDHNPYNLKFTTAIRMNATFPYVLPVVTLPTIPKLEIMDAGMRDNYGTRTSVQYMFHMREWINKNTSGVVVIRLFDAKRVDYVKQKNPSLIQDFFTPLGGLVGNVSKIHMQENDQMLQMVDEVLEVPLEVVEFRLGDAIGDKSVSMTFHLTPREKQKLRNAFEDSKIKEQLLRLRGQFFTE